MKTCFLFSFLLLHYLVWSQTEPIKWNNYYVIQKGGNLQKESCIFCNPETMPDRIVLDSSKRMIGKKSSNPYGYTYYEWRNQKYQKSYEEIRIDFLHYSKATYFTDSGQVRVIGKNSYSQGEVFYLREYYNPQKRYNGEWIAERVIVDFSPAQCDSFYKLYKIPQTMITLKTKCHYELSFYKNGHIKSFGTIITNLRQPHATGAKDQFTDTPQTMDNRYRIGYWRYFDEQGLLMQEETFLQLRKIK
jgi:hypothetical protein